MKSCVVRLYELLVDDAELSVALVFAVLFRSELADDIVLMDYVSAACKSHHYKSNRVI
jgi:hypothetical protein